LHLPNPPNKAAVSDLIKVMALPSDNNPFWITFKILKSSLSKILTSLFGFTGGILGKCLHFLYADDFLSQKIFLFLFG